MISDWSASASDISSFSSQLKSRYRVDPRVIGRGSFAVVRRCIDRMSYGECAVKSVNKSNPAFDLKGFISEIKVLQEVSHPNMISLVDVFEDDKYFHIVTDLCTGGELFTKIVEKMESPNPNPNEGCCFKEDEARRVLIDVLKAVQHMHSRGIVHRDIKPENIVFVTRNDDSPVKVVDFGFACKGDPSQVLVQFCGSLPYMAPQVFEKRYNAACDLWSVGIIAYTMIYGYTPFDHDLEDLSPEEKHAWSFCFPSSRADVSDEAKDFISKLLQVKESERMTAEQALNHPWLLLE